MFLLELYWDESSKIRDWDSRESSCRRSCCKSLLAMSESLRLGIDNLMVRLLLSPLDALDVRMTAHWKARSSHSTSQARAVQAVHNITLSMSIYPDLLFYIYHGHGYYQGNSHLTAMFLHRCSMYLHYYYYWMKLRIHFVYSVTREP